MTIMAQFQKINYPSQVNHLQSEADHLHLGWKRASLKCTLAKRAFNAGVDRHLITGLVLNAVNSPEKALKNVESYGLDSENSTKLNEIISEIRNIGQ